LKFLSFILDLQKYCGSDTRRHRVIVSF